jgi:phosphonate transport system substrate-binding protein
MKGTIPKHLLLGMASRALTPSAKARMVEWTTFLGGYVGLPVGVVGAPSYEALSEMVRRREVDLAWLPPIPFVALERTNMAIPLVSNHRFGQAQFQAVLLVRANSRIRTLVGLRGKRAAWVDPLSASGYILPRIQMAALGIDPRTTFADERFYGSHDAAVKAVIADKADVTGTYAALDPTTKRFVNGSWSKLPHAEESTRLLATFGAIPSDVIVARSDLRVAVCEIVTHALAATSSVLHGKTLVRDVFGVDEFRKWTPTSYEALRVAVSQAAQRGLLDVVAYDSEESRIT